MSIADRPLTGVTVVDLSNIIAGPLCAQMLADYGANVIKVEPPKGDESRRLGNPVYRGEAAAHYANLNRNKRSISLDLSRPEGRDVLLRLVEKADILFESFKPGAMEKWGLGYEVLGKTFPRLIYCRLNGFGGSGPLGGFPGVDMVAQAYTGITSLNGEPDGGPLRTGINAVDVITGVYAFGGILLALLERGRSGRGQSVEATLYDSALSLLPPFSSNWLMGGITPKRVGNKYPYTAPCDIYPVSDGEILLLTPNDRIWGELCKVLGHPEIAREKRFLTREDRLANVDELTQVLRTLFAPHKREPIALALLKAGVPAAPVLTVPEAFSHPHITERGMILDGPEGYRGVANPIKLSRTPATLERIPPRFAEHNREVLREAGFTDAEIDALIAGRVMFEQPRLWQAED